MPRIADRWSGTALTRRRLDRWDGAALKTEIVFAGKAVEAIPALTLNDRMDPRLGGTGTWLGGDGARSVPVGDGRYLWLFADTYKRTDGGTGAPTTRSGSTMVNDSMMMQSSADLATATLDFRFAPTGPNWFPVSGTHHAWPMDALFIGNDLYVFSMRVLSSDPLGAEYGWCIHRIANAKTLAFASWPVATLLYQSGNTGTRPLWSPYVDGAYTYVFGIKRQFGWFWARWLTTNLTGSSPGTVEYFTGAGWSTSNANPFIISDNPNTAEGSVHKRTLDGRWTITDSVGEFPLFKGGIRLANEKDPAGGYYISGGSGGYQPSAPSHQPGDHVKDGGVYDAVILSVNGDGTRVIRYDPFWGGATATKPKADLVLKSRSDRPVYENPRNYEVPLPPSYHVYAYKAHPGLTGAGSGLLVSYVDNGVLGAPLDIYVPEFFLIPPPKLSLVKVTTGGVVTWVSEGLTDRLMVRTKGGAWTELSPEATTTTVAGYVAGDTVDIRAIGSGGELIVAATAA